MTTQFKPTPDAQSFLAMWDAFFFLEHDLGRPDPEYGYDWITHGDYYDAEGNQHPLIERVRKGVAKLAGFFTDEQGKIHPIGREPSANGGEWQAKLTDKQRNAVSREWTGGHYGYVKNAILGKPIGKGFPAEAQGQYEQVGRDFTEAVRTAPNHDGAIYRHIADLNDATFKKLTSAKTLRAEGPSSFTKFDLRDRQYGDQWGDYASTRPGRHAVTFVAATHNGGDISSLSRHPDEQEVVVPHGSVYNVDKVEMHAERGGGKHAHIHISLAGPGASAKVRLAAAGSPTGFFRDEGGKVHPIFVSPGGVRQPGQSAYEWADNLTSGQKEAMDSWAHDWHPMKQAAIGAEGVSDEDKKHLSDFNEALHTALGATSMDDEDPFTPKPAHITRGIGGLSDEQFDGIVHAKTLRATSPVSFTRHRNPEATDWFGGMTRGRGHSVIFTADEHNAGDISLATGGYSHEEEVVVPQGSTYNVKSVHVEDSPKARPDGSHYKRARVHIALAPSASETSKAVRLAAAKPSFFTDSQGKIHPIGQDREPSGSSGEWQKQLTDDQKTALEVWGGNDSGWMKAMVHAPLKEVPADNQYRRHYQHFQEALHTAPSVNGPVYRVLHDLTDHTYSKLVKAKAVTTQDPASFTTEDLRDSKNPMLLGVGMNRHQGRHRVVFVADKHNAGDVSSMMGRHEPEREAVVPVGSTYRITGVDRIPKNDHFHAEEAVIHLSLDKTAAPSRVRLAANAHFFTGADGKVHPISDTTQGEAFPSTMHETSFAKHLGGSTGADLMHDSKGNQYVMKRGASPAHIENEMAANQAYQALGVPVAQFKRYTDESGNPAQVARYVEGPSLSEMDRTPHKQVARDELSKHFAAHALLANWDAHGLTDDNVQFEHGDPHKPVFIDNGGALEYRAQGALKRHTGGAALGPSVTEFDTLRDPSMNYTAAAVYGHLTGDDIRGQVKQIQGKREALLNALPTHLRDTVDARLTDLEHRAANAKFATITPIDRPHFYTDSNGRVRPITDSGGGSSGGSGDGSSGGTRAGAGSSTVGGGAANHTTANPTTPGSSSPSLIEGLPSSPKTLYTAVSQAQKRNDMATIARVLNKTFAVPSGLHVFWQKVVPYEDADGKQHLTVRGFIRDRTTAHVAEIHRTFHIDTATVNHNEMTLIPSQQGKGIALALNTHAEQAYRQMGFKQVMLGADIDVGKYAWAKQGYDFADEAARSHALSGVAQTLEQRGSTDFHAAIDDLKAGKYGPTKHSWDVAALDDGHMYHWKTHTRSGEARLGKAGLLASQGWYGVKDLEPNSLSSQVGALYARGKKT